MRIPLADSTAVLAPPEIDEKLLVLMADILPTGYFAASNGYTLLKDTERKDAVVAVVGCGPVGETHRSLDSFKRLFIDHATATL